MYPPPTCTHSHIRTHTNLFRLRLTSPVPAWEHIQPGIIPLWSEGSLSLSKPKKGVYEVASLPSPIDIFFHKAIIHFPKKHNSTKSRSNLFTRNWLITHSLSVVACIQLISAESWKTFFMLSGMYNMACCFPIPHHAFSQFKIDSSSRQRESGRKEQNIVVDV